MKDPKAFFDAVRAQPFGGQLAQPQVDGMNAILGFWEAPPVKATGTFETDWQIRSIEWLAYMLATTFHETARQMQPIREMGSNTYFVEHYCNRADLGNGPANGGEAGDGPRFKGRGYVQLTGRRNYTNFTPVVQHFYPNAPSLVTDPDAALDPEYAAVVMFYGMFVGAFTGKALKNYIGDPAKGQKVDYVGARMIINGTDRAQQIAGYAVSFQAALKAGGATA